MQLRKRNSEIYFSPIEDRKLRIALVRELHEKFKDTPMSTFMKACKGEGPVFSGVAHNQQDFYDFIIEIIERFGLQATHTKYQDELPIKTTFLRKGVTVKPWPTKKIRLLLVEDNDNRYHGFHGMTRSYRNRAVAKDPSTPYCEIVWAKSAGSAIGILRRDRGCIYAGIMLDHDLTDQKITENDRLYNGKDVVKAIIECVDTDTPILVHSSNITEGPKMAKILRGAGFAVEQQPWPSMTASYYFEWLSYVYEVADR